LPLVDPQSIHVSPQNLHIRFRHSHSVRNDHNGAERAIIPTAFFWPERIGNPHPQLPQGIEPSGNGFLE
jgi:hypothetical protein